MLYFPIIDMKQTGQNIMRLRKENGMSVRELQEIFGFATPQAIYKWQQGTVIPTIDNLVALATIFGVTLEDILAIHDGNAGKKSA
jgi:transcriptional regulator with XRE-family HTH domain